jgi:hypothetical protein
MITDRSFLSSLQHVIMPEFCRQNTAECVTRPVGRAQPNYQIERMFKVTCRKVVIKYCESEHFDSMDLAR